MRRGTVTAKAVEQAVDRDEVRERANAVDLDHGEKLAVFSLERGDTADVDELETERRSCLCIADDLECALAEMAALRVVERDSAQGRNGEISPRPVDHG